MNGDSSHLASFAPIPSSEAGFRESLSTYACIAETRLPLEQLFEDPLASYTTAPCSFFEALLERIEFGDDNARDEDCDR
jgi:hypothetical protein